MNNFTLRSIAKRDHIAVKGSTIAILGVVLGILMPLASALIYPTYTHIMQRPWVEWTRLQELPFVGSEILIIIWASRKGMDSTAMWRSLPSDVRLASLLMLVGVFASSIFISAAPLQSITISLITMLHLLFALSVSYLFGLSSSRDSYPFFMGLGFGLIVLAVLTAVKFGFPPSLSDVPDGVIEWSAAIPGFISVRHLGSWSGAITAGFAAILLYGNDRQRLSWNHFFYFLSAAITIWSGTRAAILAIMLTTAILVAMRRKIPSFRSVSILAMLTGAALIAAWILLPADDTAFPLFNSDDTNNAVNMTGGRLTLWIATFHRWLDSPWLGWGSGSVFWEVNIGWTHTQPHNVILQFLISWGIIGAIGALWLLGRAIFAVHKKVLRQPQLQPLLAILYALLLMSLEEGMLHYPRFIMLIILLFAVILSEKTSLGDAFGQFPSTDNAA
jgi:exopolysaccharide production protein ExoQ